MVGVGWILAIILGGLAGWIAEKVMHSNMGLLMNIVLGIVGAVVGNLLLMLIFGATAGGIFWQLIIAIGGALPASSRSPGRSRADVPASPDHARSTSNARRSTGRRAF